MPYRVQGIVLIEGSLDVQVLKSALLCVVRRHEILRTRYQYFPGMTWPLQVIEENAAVSIDQHDLTGWNSTAQDEKVEKLQRELRQVPFDLQQGVLFQCHLVRLSQDKHKLLLSLPALNADKKSLEVLVKEASACYASGACGESWGEPAAQYADLSEWLNDLAETHTDQMDFPSFEHGVLFRSALPLEKEVTGTIDFEPRSLHQAVPVETLAQIDSEAKRHEVSMSSYFLTCWQILLGRLTGEPEVLVGMLSDCRNHEEATGAMGLFAKYLPMVVRMEDSTPFSVLLRELNRRSKSMHERAEYFNWERIGNSSWETIFFPFCFEVGQGEFRSAAETSFRIVGQQACVDRFKVQLCVHHSDLSSLEFQYDSSLYSEHEIGRVARQFVALLTSATRNPEAGIGALNLLPHEQRRQLLIEFNETRRDYPKGRLIHELVAQHADRHPDRLAVVCDGQQVTYRELNARASRLGNYLRGLGVGPEALVGICLERSVEMVVGILGILKAGGAWLPLDPHYPKERLAFMLHDANAGVVVSNSKTAKLLPQGETRFVLLDTEWPLVSGALAEEPHSTVIANNLAYVIYTSGSTGQPKGVTITHGNVSHYVLAMAEALRVTSDDTYLHTASMSFSSSVRQLMLPLSRGATVVVASLNQIHNPIELFEAIKTNGVTIVDIVPTYWRSSIQGLSQLEGKKRVDLLDNCLRLIVSASEPLPATLPQSWRSSLSHGASLVNMFGQTETAGIVSLGPIPADLNGRGEIVGIGKPIPNMQIYLLSRSGQPVPIGVPGEVFIGGADLGRGYVNRPDLTAERFVPNPFSTEPGTRLYRTGDLARYLPDGNLEFLGRLDDQVKIRGFRIEPAEIEGCLNEHHAVRRAVVLREPDGRGDTSLVAYVALAEKYGSIVNELRVHLSRRLPEYMVPTRFVTLESLPLTPTGKIDRRALAAAGSAKSRPDQVACPPRNETERKLVSIWADILCVENPGIDQDFFALGGQSLLATRLLLRVQEVFEVNLSWQGFFAAPTIEGMAHSIEELRSTRSSVASISSIPVLGREEGEL